jgi:DNA (cytosine-5)-methyltransferase 1
MRILNLYAGVGGNRKLWPATAQVTAVELNPQIAAVYARLYPQDILIIGDAHQYLLDHYSEFDAIWSSSPCQSHTRMMKFTRHKLKRYPDLSLYQEILFLTHFFKGKWIVENVIPYYEPLIGPTTKCGRHLIWASSPVVPFEVKQPKNTINLATVAGKKVMMDWLDIHYEENIYYEGNHCPAQVLRNCVHPSLGFNLFNQVFI